MWALNKNYYWSFSYICAEQLSEFLQSYTNILEPKEKKIEAGKQEIKEIVT